MADSAKGHSELFGIILAVLEHFGTSESKKWKARNCYNIGLVCGETLHCHQRLVKLEKRFEESNGHFMGWTMVLHRPRINAHQALLQASRTNLESFNL